MCMHGGTPSDYAGADLWKACACADVGQYVTHAWRHTRSGLWPACDLDLPKGCVATLDSVTDESGMPLETAEGAKVLGGGGGKLKARGPGRQHGFAARAESAAARANSASSSVNAVETGPVGSMRI